MADTEAPSIWHGIKPIPWPVYEGEKQTVDKYKGASDMPIKLLYDWIDNVQPTQLGTMIGGAIDAPSASAHARILSLAQSTFNNCLHAFQLHHIMDESALDAVFDLLGSLACQAEHIGNPSEQRDWLTETLLMPMKSARAVMRTMAVIGDREPRENLCNLRRQLSTILYFPTDKHNRALSGSPVVPDIMWEDLWRRKWGSRSIANVIDNIIEHSVNRQATDGQASASA